MKQELAENSTDSEVYGSTEKRRPVLFHRVIENIPGKCFNTEVRALKDVENFLLQPVVLLHLEEISIKDICRSLIQKMLGTHDSRLKITDEALDSLLGECSTFANIIHGGEITVDLQCDHIPSWVCAMCEAPSIDKTYVGIACMKNPVNMGATLERVRVVILVLAPCKEKCTKNAFEVGRTFSTLFQDQKFQMKFLNATNEEEVKKLLTNQADMLGTPVKMNSQTKDASDVEANVKRCFIGDGIRSDFQRRLRYYISDYTDGFVGHHTLHKTTSTVFFLYFGCILPTIAFGSLHNSNTNGAIDVRKCIVAQAIGGFLFATFGGQPLVIMMTSAPLCIYTKVIYSISSVLHTDFSALYACVGLWSTLFLLLYSILGASKIMKWCTRSTAEIFSLFIALAFVVDASKSAYTVFQNTYLAPECENSSWGLPEQNTTALNFSDTAFFGCRRDTSLLYLMLMLGTVWLGLTLFNFRKTPYLKASKREILSDYALPVSVIVLSFIGSFVFRKVPLDQFPYNPDNDLVVAPLGVLPWVAIIASMGLGFALSLLLFIDHNLSAAMVNKPANRLHKGPAYHLDLLVLGLINGFLSVFCLPWMHGVLLHSPLHARRLADVEDRLDQGHLYEVVVKSRETRVTGIFSHILIGVSLLMLPYPLAYIPHAVLDGLFLYMAVMSLAGNQMFERFLLFFTDQASYPPDYYIRQCPQREIHKFTVSQVIQLLVLCTFGFYPIACVSMSFPVIIFLLIPIRYKVLPALINARYLDIMDSTHQ